MSRRPRWLVPVVTVGLAAVLVFWALLPWEWSMIDDPGLVLPLRDRIDEHGFLGGLVAHVGTMFSFDRDWSLFRPAHWVYPSLVYWLPIGLAHVLRLVMFGVAIAGPLVALRRRGAAWSTVAAAAAVLIAGSLTLMLGLFYVSLQELSGAAFVGLGLLLRGRYARPLAWLIAAWFKSPFAWLLIGEALAEWRTGSRRRAFVVGGVGGATLLTAGLMAARGSYTGRYLEDADFWSIVAGSLGELTGAIVLLPVGAWCAWLLASRSRPRWGRDSTVFVVGFVGYLVQMLPWSLSGYYSGGVIYVMSLLLISLMPDPRPAAATRRLVELVVPTVLALSAVYATFGYGFRANTQWREVTACLLRNPSDLVVVGREFPYENHWRIANNVQIRDPEWQGRVESEQDVPLGSVSVGSLLLVEQATTLPSGMAVEQVCSTPGAQVFRRVQ